MPDLPDRIGDVSFRLFAGDDDFPGMVAVLDAASRADGVERAETVDQMRKAYAHLVNSDPLADVLIADRPSGIVGYVRVTWYVETATDVRVLLHFGWVDPAVRGRGVEAAMLAWCEARLREVAASRAHDGETVLQSFYDEGEKDKAAVLEAAGYSVTQMYADMVRSLDQPIPDLPLPEGLRLRPTTIADAREVWEADSEAFRDHVGHSEPTEEHYQDFLTGHYGRDPSLWRVAVDDEGVAGMVLNYVDDAFNDRYGRRRGYTESISTQRRWRGRGVARALIAESMRMFRDMGMTETALGVHTDNPTGAFRLYEGLGYRVVSRAYEVRKEMASPEGG
jgi:mycothiol synthase